MLAFIMEAMCSITSRVFPVSGMRSVFTLWDNFIRTIYSGIRFELFVVLTDDHRALNTQRNDD